MLFYRHTPIETTI